jgi:hypothetical protein
MDETLILIVMLLVLSVMILLAQTRAPHAKSSNLHPAVALHRGQGEKR